MEYFDSIRGMYHYFVCPRDDYFVTNTLEKLDYHEYLYRLLLNKGYTRIIFLDEINEFVGSTEIQGKRAFTFDEASYEFYCHPRETGRAEQKLNTPKRQPDKETTLTEETKKIKYYKKISSKPLDNSESMGAEIFNHIIPALQSDIEKVAIIMSIELIKNMQSNSKSHRFGEVEYDLDSVLKLFNSTYEKQNLRNILIFTMKENGEFSNFSDFFGMLRGLEQLNFDPQKSDLEINLNELKKAKIYVEVSRKIGLDEITNLLLRKKMKLDDTDNDIFSLENVVYSKIPIYAEYISRYLENKYSASTFSIKQCEECLKDEKFIAEMVGACESIRYSDAIKKDNSENAYSLERVTGEKKFRKHISMTEIEDRFADFIGLQKVKQCVIEQFNMLEAEKKRKKVGVNTKINHGLNFIFTGNPGTGKTEMARLIGQLFCDMGMFDEQGKFVEVNRKDLIAGFQGQTALKVEKVFNKAIGGVLFIDEIYALIKDDNDTFGKEAIDTLLPLIENYSGKLVVILAGYEKEMVKFMMQNDGLNSRFPEDHRYHFSDYSEKELIQIGKKMVDKHSLKFTEDGTIEFEKQIKRLKKRARSTSGNARMIRNFVDSIVKRQSNRIATTDVEGADATLILKEDIANKQKTNKNFDFEKEFNNIIGLSSVKEKLKEQYSILIADEKRSDAGYDVDYRQSLNFVFSGNPGTGKNKMGEVVAKMLNDMGILDKRELIYTTKGDYIAEHVGGTPQKTRNQFESAIGGVLFIDEVYSFTTGGDFGQEAIDTLVPLLENNRGDVVVILAGYPEKMAGFFSKNPGLESRFPTRLRIDFPDYTAAELTEIGYVMVNESGFVIDENAKVAFEKNIKVLKTHSKSDSGNARMIRNMIEEIIIRQSKRIANNDVDDKDLNVIIESDIICDEDDGQGNETIQFAVTKKQMESMPDFYEYEKSESKVPEPELLRKTEMSVLYLEVEFGNHKGYGTGFFIHPDGYILTCNHVIKTYEGKVADKIVARMRYPGRPGGEDSYHNCVVVKTFEDLDMALIKTTDGSNFPYLKLARPEYEVREFDEFILPGYPMGALTKTGLSTYTCKISSVQKNPNGDGIDRYNIQGEAKKGNSGSPAISLETGEVIGLLPGAIQAYEGDYEEINYLRPIKYFWERFFD